MTIIGVAWVLLIGGAILGAVAFYLSRDGVEVPRDPYYHSRQDGDPDYTAKRLEYEKARKAKRRREALVGWTGIPGLALLISGGFILLLAGCFAWAADYGETKCERWGEGAQREVTFVRTTHWEWTCLVDPDDHGLIDNTNLTGVSVRVAEQEES